MARWLRQSTSVDVPIGPFLDPTDGVTPETGLTLTQPDIRLKKNGGAWAQKNAAQTLSHEENGFYEVTLDATDTNTLGLLRLAVFESGAAPVWEEFQVVTANVWDSLFGSDLLQVDVQQFGNTNGAFASGWPEVNVALWRGSQPNTLISGRVNADTQAMGDSVISAGDLLAIADAVWDEDATAHQTDGTFGQAIGDAAGGDSIWTAVDNLAGVANNTFNAVTNLPSSSAIATEIFDQGDGVETGLTFREWLRLMYSANIGKVSGFDAGSPAFRDFGDTKDRITATVTSDGRTAVTVDAT